MNPNEMMECSILDTQLINTISKDGNGTVVPSYNNIAFFFKVLCNYWTEVVHGTLNKRYGSTKNQYALLKCQIAMMFQRMEAECASNDRYMETLTLDALRALFKECRQTETSDALVIPSAVRADFMAAILKLLIEESSPRNPRQLNYCSTHERFCPFVSDDVRFNVCFKCRSLNEIRFDRYTQVRVDLKRIWNSRVPPTFHFGTGSFGFVFGSGRVTIGMKVPAIVPQVVEYQPMVVPMVLVEAVESTESTEPAPEVVVEAVEPVPEVVVERVEPEPAVPAAAPAAPAVPATPTVTSLVAMVELSSALKSTMKKLNRFNKSEAYMNKQLEISKKRGRPALQKAVETMLDPDREAKKLMFYINKKNDEFQTYVIPLRTLFQQQSCYYPDEIAFKEEVYEGQLQYSVNGYQVYFDTSNLYDVERAWILVPFGHLDISKVIICKTPEEVYEAARNQYDLNYHSPMSPLYDFSYSSQEILDDHFAFGYGVQKAF